MKKIGKQNCPICGKHGHYVGKNKWGGHVYMNAKKERGNAIVFFSHDMKILLLRKENG